MRLFHIDEPGCHHITEIMDGIKAVYQLEQEFFPYLTVEFLPHRDRPAGIILLTRKGDSIRKYYKFKDPKDIEELRSIIWYYLERDYNIKQLPTDKCGNLQKFKWEPTSDVIQGWQSKKRAMKGARCCKIIADIVASELVSHATIHYNILHEQYRLSGQDVQTREICKQLRLTECGNNYPPNTPTFKRCVDEVNWLCNNSYPKNKAYEASNKLVKNTRKKIHEYLDKNNMLVDKKIFDDIIDAGLFQRVANRMGNKSINFIDAQRAVNDEFNDRGYMLQMIEDFDKVEGFAMKDIPVRNKLVLPAIAILVILLLFALFKDKNIETIENIDNIRLYDFYHGLVMNQ